MNAEARTTSGNRLAPVALAYHEVVRFAVWPRDPHGWVFIGRAIDRLGRATFTDWKPYTPYGLLPDVMVGVTYDGMAIAPEAQALYADWLINKRGDDPDFIFRADKPFAYLDHEGYQAPLSDEQWGLAVDMSQQEWAIGQANRRMFSDIQAKIIQSAESGDIVVGSRPIQGGKPVPTPDDWWFTDRYEARFKFTTIDPSDPFSCSEPDADRAHHLFLREADLNAMIGMKSSSSLVSAEDDAYLSRYMRLMLEVANDLKLSQANPVKKEIIISELNARWNKFLLPPSANLLNAAASMLRDPESQAGRARKSVETSKG